MRPFIVCLIGIAIAGCTQQDPNRLALEAGLAPPPVDATSVRVSRRPSTETRLGQMLAVTTDHAGAELPAPPPPPKLTYEQFIARSSYQGWLTDRIDASSFDNLTDSLNAILQKMTPLEAEDFDKVVKYVLMQVTRDPLVAKKAAGGGQMSDADLLRAIQSYVHDRTPKDITDLAEQFYKRQQFAARQVPGGASAGMPSVSDMGGLP